MLAILTLHRLAGCTIVLARDEPQKIIVVAVHDWIIQWQTCEIRV